MGLVLLYTAVEGRYYVKKPYLGLLFYFLKTFYEFLVVDFSSLLNSYVILKSFFNSSLRVGLTENCVLNFTTVLPVCEVA